MSDKDLSSERIGQLRERAKHIRRETIRLAVPNHGTHFGAFFSIPEILVSLYDEVMKPEDRFILSEGHACFPWYVILREKGYSPKIRAHPDLDPKNGIYATTGSLGHGLPMAIGMAMARKLQNKDGRFYVLMGDAEVLSGTTWESFLIANPESRLNRPQGFCLDNLCVIVNNNSIQGSGRTGEIVPIISSLKSLAQGVKWDVRGVDGHDYSQLIPALREPYFSPRLVIANTLKGKGVSFMEDRPEWHSRMPTPDQIKQAYEELR